MLRILLRLGAAALFVAAAGRAVVACSDDRPPAGGVGTTPQPTGEGGTTEGGALVDVNVVDADADAEPTGPCVGDALDAGDAGADADASLVCPEGACKPACERVIANYRGGVAQVAIACIAALPSCTTAAEIVPCVDQGIAAACLEPEAKTFCTPIVSACPDIDAGSISQPFCESFVKGFNATGRAAFNSCIQGSDAGTCADAIHGCADTIRQ